MPSLIGVEVNGVSVTANYLKAKPSTRFATRQLAFVEIEVTNCHVDPYDSNSLYSRAIRGVQTVAEVYAVGEPSASKFMVVIAQDTDGAEDNNDINGNSASDAISMQTAVANSLYNEEVTINAVYKHLHGAGFANNVMTYSDESLEGNNYWVGP